MKQKNQKTTILILALIGIILLIGIVPNLRMAVVGDERLLANADSLTSGYNEWIIDLGGTVALDSSTKTEGTASVKATVTTGAWGMYLRYYMYPLISLADEKTLKFSILPTGMLANSEIQFSLQTYNFNPIAGADTLAGFTTTILPINGQWNEITIDLSLLTNGADNSGYIFATPDLSQVAGFQFVYVIHEDVSTTHTLNLDNIRAV